METNHLYFCEKINNSYEEEIQNLFFFHMDQSKYKRRILKAISKYGKPELVKKGTDLTFYLCGNTNPQQTFFVLSNIDKPIVLAIVIWVKIGTTINLAHFVLNKSVPNSNIGINFDNVMVALTKMIGFYKGIDSVGLAYSERKVEVSRLANYYNSII
jgi:hypothetical protein